jgi:methylated-DNA-[protein]-cysteine S-methyltransferase
VSDEIERALRSAGGAEMAGAAERASRGLADRAAGAGLVDVAYATVDSPVGPLWAAVTRRGLVTLAYDHEPGDHLLERIALAVSPRILEAPSRLDEVRRELDEYFEGRRREFEIPIDWSLVTGGYARAVLRQTARIPYGQNRSYAEVASAAGSPRGWRAAGNALGANPIPIVVPCHRVLRSGGAMGGYGGGPDRKRFLLALEGGQPTARKS